MPRSIPPRPDTNWHLLGAALGLFSLIALFALAALSYASANRWLQHTLLVRRTADDWLLTLLDAESSVRGYVLTQQSAFLQPYEEALSRERVLVRQLRQSVPDNPHQLDNVDLADQHAQDLMEHLRQLHDLVRSGRVEQAVALVSTGEGWRFMHACRQDMQRIGSEEARILAQRRASADLRALVSAVSAVLLTLTALGLLVYAFRRERAHDDLLKTLAREARQRLAWIFEVTSALAQARTRGQVADVVITQGMRAASADTCTLYVLNDAGSELQLIGERGVAPALLPGLQKISDNEGTAGMFSRVRESQSLWAENESEYLAIFPGLASMKVEGRRAKAFWSVPLYVEGHAIGLLGMGFYTERKFSPDERAFNEAFANQCAQALQRATRLEREDEANRWLTTTLRSIGDAVIATDNTGRIAFMNPVAEKLTRWDANDARGRPLEEVFSIFSEQTRLPVESPVTKVLREGKVVGLANHTVLRAKGGTEIPIDDSGAPIAADNGELLGVVLVFRDATHEKREHARREFLAAAGEILVSSLDYQATLAAVAQLAVPEIADWCTIDIVEAGSARRVAVGHVDPNKVQFARELSERYPPDPNATTGVPNVMRTGRSELHEEISQEMVEAGARDEEHLRMLRQLQLTSAMVVPLRARTRTLGAITFVYAESARRYRADDLAFAEDFARRAAMALDNALVLRDAEQARAQERSMRSEAEVASRAKDEFLATVSHELRTPLTAILGWAVVLRDRKPGPEIDRGLAVIERNARAQAKLIEDVLDVSRVISGKLALNLVPTDVGDAVEAAIDTVTPAAEAKSVTLSANIAEADLHIVADPDRVQQVVWNLLANAVKFSSKGGQVTARVEREDQYVSIHVTDTGEGIRPEALPFIFEPFHQADGSTTRRHGGLGLGLAIVKQLVAAHGGTVRASSDGPGRGATFVVQLPVRASMPPLVRNRRAILPVELGILASKETHARLDALKLLLVDDEQDVLAAMGEVLRERGAIVHVASSAGEALARFAEIRPDVILSDIGMPGEDGYSFIRKIRALPVDAGGRTPAIALTAYARGEDAQRAFAAGYQMHIAKPVEPGHLVTVVANLGGRTQSES
jgi:PAS domain S-box-containing protein